MSDLIRLLSNLASNDAALRDRSALELMDIGDPIAIEPLIDAILKPENENHRGTLVFSLGEFDCSDHIDLLIDLVLSGSFEVASAAFNIIGDLPLNTELKNRVRRILCQSKALTEDGKEGYDELLELIK